MRARSASLSAQSPCSEQRAGQFLAQQQNGYPSRSGTAVIQQQKLIEQELEGCGRSRQRLGVDERFGCVNWSAPKPISTARKAR